MNLDILALDAIAIQQILLDGITGTGDKIVDPTNPLAMLIEAETTSIIGVADSITTLERKIFPQLSRSLQDLYPHFIEGDEINLFASPVSTDMRILIDVNSIMSFAIKEDNKYTFVIPKESSVIVDEYKFIFVNDIKITINTNGAVYNSFIEIQHDGSDIEFKSVGNVRSSIMPDEKNNMWLTFDAPVKQLDFISVTDRLITSLEFEKTQKFNDQLYYTEVFTEDMSGNLMKLKKVFSDDYFDPTEPCVFVRVLDGEITYRIDSIYIGTYIKRKLDIQIWTTKGKIKVDLSNFENPDFKFTISGVTDTVEKSVSTKMNYLAISPNIVDGGSDVRSIRDIRKKIVNRSSGKMDYPITQFQLNEAAKLYGFTISKSLDLITERVFIAGRDINDLVIDDSVPATLIMNNRVKIEYSEAIVGPRLVFTDDYTLIKPGKLFKNKNGLILPIKTSETEYINNLSQLEKRTYLNANNIYFNPFLYVIDNDIKSIDNRIYDIDDCKSDFLNIISKNQHVNINVNITQHEIFRKDDGYDMFFTLFGNEEYTNDSANIKIQLQLNGELSDTYFHSEIDPVKTEEYYGTDVDAKHYIRIDSNLFINNHDQLLLTNGYNAAGSRLVSLDTTAKIIIYTENTDITIDETGEAVNFLIAGDIQDNAVDTIGLTKETVNIVLGKGLKYLWNRVDSTYTNNKYVRYTENIEAKYPKDIYEKINNRPYTIDTAEDGTCTIVKNLLHSAGDVMLDTEGNVIYEHKINDIVFNEGEPVIDTKSGILKYVDILMLEYSYVTFNKTSHIKHINYVINIIREWLNNALININKETLEQTTIYYRPRRNGNLLEDSADANYNKLISPTVTVYYYESDNVNIDYGTAYRQLGELLNRHFSKRYININDIELNILKIAFPNALNVKISNFVVNDPNIINLTNSSNRFEISKKIDDDFNVMYDYEMKIEVI